MVRRLLLQMRMLRPTLREIHALPPPRPPRGLAIVMGLTTALVLAAGTFALASTDPAGSAGLALRALARPAHAGLCHGPR